MSTRNPLHLLRARFRRWFESRLALVDMTVLTQRNVYILPTRPGLMLAATLLVLLAASINYQLNLGYLLTFLLAGSALVSMHVCHGTLRGITLSLRVPDAVFKGTAANLSITLSSQRRSPRYGIGVSVLGSTHGVWTDIPAQGSAIAQVSFKPEHRGLQRVPTLTAETRFPLGTFRVWTVWRPAAHVLVYPSAEPHPPALPQGEPQGGSGTANQHDTGEHDGIRAYRRGDPMKLIVWKKTAQSDAWVSRDSQRVQRTTLWLDLHNTGTSHPELQLSRLCAWVLQAEKAGVDYGLRLPPQEIQPDHGDAHQKRCLQALALH